MNHDLYQTTTDRILGMLDTGTVPWRHPIRGPSSGGGVPCNLVSGKAYRGINVFLLAVTGWALGYASPHWLTYRQALKLGGHVRKGEKSTPIIFWKQHTIEDRETGKNKPVPVLRHYHVFNIEQCANLTAPAPGSDGDDAEANTLPGEPLEEAERIVAGYERPPVIERGGGSAYYRADTDTVRIPPSARFVDREAYYATLFHELAHSTGHPRRLNREAFRVVPGREPGSVKPTAPFGSAEYSKEELVAEMGAAFLAAAAGISPPTIEQSAAYIDGWRRQIKADKKLVIQAAGQGQRAADLILGQAFEAVAEAAAPTRPPATIALRGRALGGPAGVGADLMACRVG